MSGPAYLTSGNKKIINANNALQTKNSTNYHAELHDSYFNRIDGTQDWLAAKAEIDNLLQTSKSGYELLQKSKEVSDYWNRVREQRRKDR